MSEFVKFKVDVKPNGQGVVVINDHDVSQQVSGFTLQARVGAPPMLTLQHIAASGPIQGEGIVQVTETGDTISSSEVIRKFLAAIDPDELDSAALDATWMGESGIARSMLRVLMRWAGGD